MTAALRNFDGSPPRINAVEHMPACSPTSSPSKLNILHASADRDIDAVFATLARRRATGLVINPYLFVLSRTWC
jgi:hypothetical protein